MKLTADAQAVIDEVVPVAGELRMKCEAEQSALAFVIELAIGALDEIQEKVLCRHWLIQIRHDLDASGLFDDEQTIFLTWSTHHGHRHRKRQSAKRIFKRIRHRR